MTRGGISIFLLALISLTLADGRPLYLYKEQVTGFFSTEPRMGAADGAHTQIDVTSGKSYFVRESTEQVKKALEK